MSEKLRTETVFKIVCSLSLLRPHQQLNVSAKLLQWKELEQLVEILLLSTVQLLELNLLQINAADTK